jgi:hypothetical protein
MAGMLQKLCEGKMTNYKYFVILVLLMLFVGTSSAYYQEQWAGETGKGIDGVMVPLGIPPDYLFVYTWISLCFLFLIAASASQRNGEFWAILLPLFAALFVWWGWLVMPAAQGMGIIIMAAILALGVYFKGKQQASFGIAGPGSPFLNIVFWMIIMQASIGFINGLHMFDANSAVTPLKYQTVDLEATVPNYAQTGGVGADIASTMFFAAQAVYAALIMMWSVLMGIIYFKGLVLSIAPFMNDYAVVDAFLTVITIGIDFIIAVAVWTWLFKPPIGENI